MSKFEQYFEMAISAKYSGKNKPVDPKEVSKIATKLESVLDKILEKEIDKNAKQNVFLINLKKAKISIQDAFKGNENFLDAVEAELQKRYQKEGWESVRFINTNMYPNLGDAEIGDVIEVERF